MPPTISQVNALSGLGVFRDFRATAATPELRRYNLIYGFNGSGKTILSRVLASLESGDFSPNLPDDGTFEIGLSDGSSIRSMGALDAVKGQVLVFNVDFIEQNLRWKDGTANPVFFLGKKQTGLARKMDEVDAELATVVSQRGEVERNHERQDRAFTGHKRDAARLIAVQLGLGRNYDASDLVADYEKGPFDAKRRLSEDERQQLRGIIIQEAPLAKREALDAETIDLAGLTRVVWKVLGMSLGTMAIEDLRDHEAMMKWVREGLDYHRDHNLSACLFCGKELTEERMRALAAAIDDRFDRLTADIAEAREKAEALRDRFSALKGAIPSDNDISQEHRSRFTAASAELRFSLSRGEEVVRTMLGLLEKKAAAPNVSFEATGLVTESEASEWDEAFVHQVSAIDAVMADHNRSHDEFAIIQVDARDKLKAHFLAESQEHYGELASEAARARDALDRLEERRATLADEADSLRREMREHGVAADRINRMIRSYLGHAELELGTLEEGYQLRRNGKPVTGSLSEGEKTAIAICYFLATLEAEGRRLKDLIVVVDDPISSLDTKALHYAFSILKAMLADAAQVIILTHNLHFMNEGKKWLKNKTEKEAGPNKATATLLFLASVQREGEETRSSSIVEMPRHIREYESEYQHLFHLVLRFLETPEGAVGYFHIMPNALRKVLEIFLAFKVPGSDGLGAKIKEIVNDTENDGDAARVLALERLVQLESHADNLDDLVTHSSMTVEETKDAAHALMALMEALDKVHYNRMRRICRV